VLISSAQRDELLMIVQGHAHDAADDWTGYFDVTSRTRSDRPSGAIASSKPPMTGPTSSAFPSLENRRAERVGHEAPVLAVLLASHGQDEVAHVPTDDLPLIDDEKVEGSRQDLFGVRVAGHVVAGPRIEVRFPRTGSPGTPTGLGPSRVGCPVRKSTSPRSSLMGIYRLSVVRLLGNCTAVMRTRPRLAMMRCRVERQEEQRRGQGQIPFRPDMPVVLSDVSMGEAA